jgi:hypothetical protein
MAYADVHARDVGSPSGDAPQHTKVGEYAAIVYSDAIGWTSISWSPGPDLLLSVTGWKTTYAQIETLAEKAVVQ